MKSNTKSAIKTKYVHKSTLPAFGRNLERFSTKGLHPQLFIRNPALLKKTVLQIHQYQPPAQVKKNTFEQLYDTIKALSEPTAKPIDKQTAKEMKTKLKQIKGLNWQLALNTELATRIPCVLYLDTWELNKEKEELLGPTKYNVQEFQKPYNTSGVMSSKQKRFYSALHKPNTNPGPGNYGAKGIPYVPMGDVARKDKYCSSKKTMMANQPRKPFQSSGGYLAPNVYFRGVPPNTIEEFVKRKVSLRGPYDIFSGNREKRIRTGWLAQSEVFDHESEAIGHVPTTVRMHDKGTINITHNDREARPAGRFVCESNAHFWGSKLTPPPNHYEKKSDMMKCSFHVKNIPFNKSSRRFDTLTARRFFVDYDVCGPGRYDIKSTLGKQTKAAANDVTFQSAKQKSKQTKS